MGQVRGVQVRGGNVALQVIHRHQRELPAIRNGLGHGHADQQGSDQSRPGGHRDGADVGQRDPGVREGALDDRRDDLDVPPRGQLRTIPPYGACTSTWEATTCCAACGRPRDAAAVSSHELSMPRSDA